MTEGQGFDRGAPGEAEARTAALNVIPDSDPLLGIPSPAPVPEAGAVDTPSPAEPTFGAEEGQRETDDET